MTNESIDIYTKDNAIKWNSNGGCDGFARPWVVNNVYELAKKYGAKSLLDIGSGTGRWTKLLSNGLEKVVGLDISPEMVKIAMETNSASNINYLHKDILTANLGKFDIVTALAMLHHAQNREELNKIYDKINRTLNLNGHFLFYTPHPISVFTSKSKIACYEKDPNATYNTNFPFVAKIAMQDGSTRTSSGYHHSIEEYIGDLTKHGFSITKMEELTAEADSIPSALVIDAQKIN